MIVPACPWSPPIVSHRCFGLESSGDANLQLVLSEFWELLWEHLKLPRVELDPGVGERVLERYPFSWSLDEHFLD